MYTIQFEPAEDAGMYHVIYQGVNIGTASLMWQAHALVDEYIDHAQEEAAEAAEFDLDF